ncbi:hypothetical protein Agub_g11225 [Astrephomene gubernaculifera]|uniref:Thioredoxin-like fold domain-containing protein n=1 Tax=Astrephomene gubernaculifera TaxID=47775 RepID=A0AAD3DW54_9CHLO|nr:hypothetical protein Agub_g11225 [Astrephomene gubernaculifera]
MHVLPDLAQLESQFAGAPVAVVGVHSAKFDNERDSSAIRAAVLRYDISHPVVNDARMALWGALGVSAWPTLAVVSPRGRLLAMLSGEGHRQDLEDLLTAALQYYSEAGQLDGSTPLPLDPERNKQAPSSLLSSSPLRYPGKLACDPAGGRLFISDSNNHRILVTDLSGGFIQQIGGNGPALRDGSLDSACFNRPQGLVFSAARNALFVADTENHAVRCCDLAAGTVVTLAGNGSKGGDYRGGRSGSAQPLNSPWDVELDEREENLYIALAGQHQIWRLELGQTRGSPSASSSSSSTSSGIGAAALFSGTGSERNQNGPTPLTTSWAQPSGLSRARDGSGLMYVADSESSSVRVVDLASGASGPKAGGDPLFSDNLFRFGDKDGFGAEALLQHPLAVLSSADGSAVYVADSYNHRIKVLNPNTNELVTLAGSGVAGFRDGVGTEAQFSEPAGLCLGPEGVIFVADTNNNAVRMLDPTSRRVTTLTLRDVPAPRVDPLMTVASATRGSAGDGNIANGSNSPPPPPGFQVVRSQRPLVIGGGGSSASGSLTVTVALPSGYHLTAGAGSSYYTQVVASGNNGATAANVTSVAVSPASGLLPDTAAPSVTLTVQPTTAFPALTATPRPPLLLRVLSKVYYCQLNDVCLFEQVCFEVPLQLGAAAASAAGGGGGGAAGQAAVDLRYEVLPATQPTFVLQ